MALNSPFTITLYIDFPPLPVWSSLSELSEMLPSELWSSSCPQSNLTRNSQVVHLFLVASYGNHEGTQSGLPSFHWTLQGIGALVPAAATCAHLPPRRAQTNLGNILLVLGSPMLVEILNFIWWWSRLPASSR